MSEPRSAGVTLREPPPPGLLNLRGDAGDAAFRDAVAAALGVAPPTAPCTWRRAGGAALYWLGPDEWLAAVARGDEQALEGGLRERLRESQGGRFAVTDVSGGNVLFELAGPAARQVLAKSCVYDLHPRRFPPGRCAQTPLAKANALIAAVAPGAFKLILRRSYATYARDWLMDAGREYGLVTP